MTKQTDDGQDAIEETAHADRDGFRSIDDISRLAEVMGAHGLDEIDVLQVRGDSWRTRIRLSKAGAKGTAGGRIVQTQAAAPETASPPSAPEADSAGPDLADHPGAVVAPMIGTVYLQAQPGSPKFVEIGGAVEEGQILLIIEAMKTMNHIHAPRAGTVRRILVENNSVVEYGTPLMIIE